jgi:sulfur carrier protein
MNTIRVNGEPREVDPGCTLADLLEALGHAPDAVATAVDGEFVPRDARAAQTLRPGACVTFFQAIVGG